MSNTTNQTSPVPCRINVAYGDLNPAGLPVAAGVPFPKGTVRPETPFAVRSPAGEPRPVAVRPLALWPDGSVRWALLSFGARQAGGHEVLPGQTAATAAPTLALRHEGERWTIESDRVRLVVSETGAGPIHELVVDSHPYLRDPTDLQLCVSVGSTQFEPERQVRVLE
ncbi:hypothetical protein HQ590_03575, partial [bacterium]|nr:hypothetical protein [bacterium]